MTIERYRSKLYRIWSVCVVMDFGAYKLEPCCLWHLWQQGISFEEQEGRARTSVHSTILAVTHQLRIRD